MKSVHGTLVADTVTTHSIAHPNADWVVVTIRKGATGPISFTVDGTEPTKLGADTLTVQSVGEHSRAVQIHTSNVVEVKLISASADDYDVEVF